MGASIHINGTGSSVVDTVFVCRSTGSIDRRTVVRTPEEIAALVLRDCSQLQRGGVSCSPGDLRCIAYGHLTRLAIWFIRTQWKNDATVHEKIELIDQTIKSLGGAEAVERRLKLPVFKLELFPALLKEDQESYDASIDQLHY